MAWDFIVFGGSGFVVFDRFSAHGRSTIQRFKLKYLKKLLILVFCILMKKNYSSSSIQSNIIKALLCLLE